jgi:hypothetical protein
MEMGVVDDELLEKHPDKQKGILRIAAVQHILNIT